MKTETQQITDKLDILYGKYIHTVRDENGKTVAVYSSDSKIPISENKKMLKARKYFNEVLNREV